MNYVFIHVATVLEVHFSVLKKGVPILLSIYSSVDAVNEIGPLLVKLPRLIAQNHMTCAWRNLFSKCVSIVVYALSFLSDKKFILLKCAHKFLCAFLKCMRILPFPSRVIFLCDIPKCT